MPLVQYINVFTSPSVCVDGFYHPTNMAHTKALFVGVEWLLIDNPRGQ